MHLIYSESIMRHAEEVNNKSVLVCGIVGGELQSLVDISIKIMIKPYCKELLCEVKVTT